MTVEDDDLAAAARAVLDDDGGPPLPEDAPAMAGAAPLEMLGDAIDDDELAAITQAALGTEDAGDAAESPTPEADAAQPFLAVTQELDPADFDPASFADNLEEVLAADEQLTAPDDAIGPLDTVGTLYLTPMHYPGWPWN